MVFGAEFRLMRGSATEKAFFDAEMVQEDNFAMK